MNKLPFSILMATVPGGSGLAGTRNVSILDFIEAWDEGGGGDNGTTRRAKLQTNGHHQQTITQ